MELEKLSRLGSGRKNGLLDHLIQFKEFGAATRLTQTQARLFSGEALSVPTCVNAFWTAKQRVKRQ